MNRLVTLLAAAIFVALVPGLCRRRADRPDRPDHRRAWPDEADSALITDSTQQPFGPCNAALGLPSGDVCSDYEITPSAGGIFSLDLTFQFEGTPIPVTLLQLDPLSGFGVDDGNRRVYRASDGRGRTRWAPRLRSRVRRRLRSRRRRRGAMHVAE